MRTAHPLAGGASPEGSLAATARARRLGAGDGVARAALFAVLAGAFLVLASVSNLTWSEVRGGTADRYRAQLASVVRAHEAGSRARELAGAAVGVAGVLVLLRRRQGAARVEVHGALPWALAAYAALSAASLTWSDEPAITARRVAGLAVMGAAVAAVGWLLDRDALRAFAAFASATYVALAVAVELVTGAFRPFEPEYRLSGLFHPNTVGAFAAILVLAVVCGRRLRGRWLGRAALALGIIALALSRSRSSVLGLSAALVARWVVVAPPSRKVVAALAAGWLACAAALVLGEGAGAAARDALVMSRADSRLETLSGRTGLWEDLLGYAAERPLLGYGPGAFWSARHLEAIYASQRWPASEAHSLYLEQLLDLGGIGLALLVLLLGGGALRAARWLRASGDGPAAFLLCVPVYFASAGAVEVLHAPPSFLSFLLFGALAHLALRRGPGAPERANAARARGRTPGRRSAARVPAWRGA